MIIISILGVIWWKFTFSFIVSLGLIYLHNRSRDMKAALAEFKDVRNFAIVYTFFDDDPFLHFWSVCPDARPLGSYVEKWYQSQLTFPHSFIRLQFCSFLMGALRTRKLLVAADSIDTFEKLKDIAWTEYAGDWSRILHFCIPNNTGYAQG